MHRIQAGHHQGGDSDKVLVSKSEKGGLREIKCKKFCISLDTEVRK